METPVSVETPVSTETNSGAAGIIARINELLACDTPPPGAMLQLRELHAAAAEQHAMREQTRGSGASLDGIRTSRTREKLHNAAAVEKMYRARGMLRTGPPAETITSDAAAHVLLSRDGENSKRSRHPLMRYIGSRALKSSERLGGDLDQQRLQQLQMRQQRNRARRENDAAEKAREAAVIQAREAAARAVRAHVTSAATAVERVKGLMDERERPSTAGGRLASYNRDSHHGTFASSNTQQDAHPPTIAVTSADPSPAPSSAVEQLRRMREAQKAAFAEQRADLLGKIKGSYQPASRPTSRGPRGAGSAGSTRKPAVAWPPATSAPHAAPAPASTSAPASRKPSTGDPLVPYGYSTQSPIAAGAFSTIVRARRISSGEEFAVKTLTMRMKGGKQVAAVGEIEKEIQALVALRRPSHHPHIANLVQTFETDCEVHVILEYCGGGSVKLRLNQQGHSTGLPEGEGANLTAQVGCALAHMHSVGVTHRDIKPDNVIFTDRSRTSVRVVDFGFAGMAKGPSGRLRTVCGSPAYMAPELAPEIAAGKPYLGPPVDVWALGCFLYELVHNKVAFRGDSIAALNSRIRKGDHTPFNPGTSSKIKHAVKRMLTVEVGERVTAAALTLALIERFSLTIAASDSLR